MPEDLDNKNIFRKLNGKIKKHTFVGFDIETTNEGTKFVSLALYDERTGESLFITDQERAAKEMIRPKYSGCTFVATNLTFDFCGVYWDLPLWNDFRILMRDGDILCASYVIRERERERFDKKTGNTYTYKDKEYVRFLDTFNYVKMGVAKLGKVIGLEKIEPPSWLGERLPETPDEWQEYETYNVRDAEVSCKFMRFWEDSVNDLGAELKLTAASTALDLFRRQYMVDYWLKERVRIRGDDPEDFIRKGYYGGRTEVFERGLIEDANYYDINSLYPSVMKGHDYPLPQSAEWVQEPCEQMIYFYEGVSEVTIYCPDSLNIPLLPVRTPDKLLFPVGSFSGVYNHVELREALKRGYVLRGVHKQLIYHDVMRPFDGFVTDLYNKRLQYKKEGNKMDIAAKLMLNSLYGKWAENTLSDTKIIRITEHHDDMQLGRMMSGYTDVDEFDNHILLRKAKRAEGKHIFPILSSYCTSYARLKLYSYLETHKPIYCDTDSIITKDVIPTSTELGHMKLEKTITKGVITRAKLYELDGDVKAKGFGRIYKETYDLLLSGKEVLQTRVMKPRGSLRRGMPINWFHTMTKTVNVEDDKREWSASFSPLYTQESKPLCLKED